MAPPYDMPLPFVGPSTFLFGSKLCHRGRQVDTPIDAQPRADQPHSGEHDEHNTFTSSNNVIRVRRLELMDLPKEIRMMIYHHALREEGVQTSFPALLSVCRQIRDEATRTFFRVNLFALNMVPHPHTKMISLGFDGRTHKWLEVIGPKHVQDLRHVEFRFPAFRGPQTYNAYQIKLSCRNAGEWLVGSYHRGTCWRFKLLKDEFKPAKRYAPSEEFKLIFAVLGWSTSDSELAEIERRDLESCETAMQHVQETMDRFADTCGEGRLIKPTMEELEKIGGAFTTVDKILHSDWLRIQRYMG